MRCIRCYFFFLVKALFLPLKENGGYRSYFETGVAMLSFFTLVTLEIFWVRPFRTGIRHSRMNKYTHIQYSIPYPLEQKPAKRTRSKQLASRWGGHGRWQLFCVRLGTFNISLNNSCFLRQLHSYFICCVQSNCWLVVGDGCLVMGDGMNTWEANLH